MAKKRTPRQKKWKKKGKVTSPTTMVKMSKNTTIPQGNLINTTHQPGRSIRTFSHKKETLGIWESKDEYIVGIDYKPTKTKNEDGSVNMTTKPFEELLRTKDKKEAEEMFEKLKTIKFG